MKKRVTVKEKLTIKQTIELLQKEEQLYAAVCDGKGQILGGINLKELIFKVKTKQCAEDEEVGKVTNLKQRRVHLEESLDVVLHSIQVHDFVILETDPSIIISSVNFYT